MKTIGKNHSIPVAQKSLKLWDHSDYHSKSLSKSVKELHTKPLLALKPPRPSGSEVFQLIKVSMSSFNLY